MDLEQGLLTYLQQQPDIVGLVSNRITPVFLPQGYDTPAIVFRRVGGSKTDTLAGPVGSANVLFDLTAWDTDYFGAKRLTRYIRAAMSGGRKLFGDIEVLDITAIDGSEEDVIDDLARASNVPYGVQAQYAVLTHEGVGVSATPSTGTVLQLGDGGAPEVFTSFADVLTISAPTQRREAVEVSLLEDEFEESLRGPADPGELNFRLSFKPSDPVQSPVSGLLHFFLMGGQYRTWRLVFPTAPATDMTFSAAVVSYQVQIESGQPLVANVSLGLTGQPVWAM